MKKIVISVLSILILGAAIGSGWFWWIRTPQYSMGRLAESIHKHDLETFQNYCDVDSLASNAINDLSNEELREIGGSQLLRKFLGIAIVGTLGPELSESLAKGIRNYVGKTPEQVAAEAQAAEQEEAEKRRKEGLIARMVDGFVDKVVEAIKPPPLRQVLKDLGFSKDNFKGLTDFKTDGTKCEVGLKFARSPAADSSGNATQPTDAPVVVMLELENANEHWHVTRISNMDALARNLTAGALHRE